MPQEVKGKRKPLTKRGKKEGMFVRIGIAARLWGVSPSTMRRWEKEERVRPAFRTKGGHRRYELAELVGKKEGKARTKRVVGYARVSAQKQREELRRQKEQIQSFCIHKGWELNHIYTDIASGMNEQRKGLQRLLKTIATNQPYAVVCTYEDRLARFGTKVIQHYCQTFGTKLQPIYQSLNHSTEGRLVEDMIAVVTSFAGRLHRQRRGK